MTPLAVHGHVFNVDTLKEGSLARIGYDDIDKNIVREAPPGAIAFGVTALNLLPRFFRFYHQDQNSTLKKRMKRRKAMSISRCSPQ